MEIKKRHLAPEYLFSLVYLIEYLNSKMTLKYWLKHEKYLDYAVSGVNSHFDLVESMNIIGGIIANTKQELQIIVDNQWFQLVNDNPINSCQY